MLLRAQDYAAWSASLTLKLFNQVLSYVTHTKPNIRKAAQRAIESIIHGSCFMAASNSAVDQASGQNSSLTSAQQPIFQPAGAYVAYKRIHLICAMPTDNRANRRKRKLSIIQQISTYIDNFFAEWLISPNYWAIYIASCCYNSSKFHGHSRCVFSFVKWINCKCNIIHMRQRNFLMKKEKVISCP